MWAGVSTPTLVSRWALFASAIWSPDAPTPTLLVAACADSAAFLTLSMNPIRCLASVEVVRRPIAAGSPRLFRLPARAEPVMASDHETLRSAVYALEHNLGVVRAAIVGVGDVLTAG